MISYDLIGHFSFWMIITLIVIKLSKVLWNNILGQYIVAGVKWDPNPNNWVIITGATDGIGLEYARQFAQKGYCLILISRTQQKLERVSDEIIKQFPKCPKIKILPVNFTERNIYAKIETEINAINGKIDVLINNVGMTNDGFEYFNENHDKNIDNLINCNILSCVKMTQMVLPKMVANNRGIIINLSSVAGSFPIPLTSLYSSTKVFVDYFSRSLQKEYNDKGIIIQSVRPGYVSTQMTNHKNVGPFVASAHEYVKSQLKTVGIEEWTYGWSQHKLMGYFIDIMDKSFGIFINDINSRLAYYSIKNVRKIKTSKNE